MNEQIPLLPELIFRIHYYYPTICETEVRLNTKKEKIGKISEHIFATTKTSSDFELDHLLLLERLLRKYQNLSECDCCHILNVRVHLLKSKSPHLKKKKEKIKYCGPSKKICYLTPTQLSLRPLKNHS